MATIKLKGIETHYKKLINAVKKAARENGWELYCYQNNIKMLSYYRNGDRINVYYSTRTVGTRINHPKKGKTQLFRKNLSEKDIVKIFKNPRHHTGKGYYTNGRKN